MAIETTQADDTTATLISRAADGEEAAFARIVAAHHDDMTRVCFVIAGDLDIADEAVQAAWSNDEFIEGSFQLLDENGGHPGYFFDGDFCEIVQDLLG